MFHFLAPKLSNILFKEFKRSLVSQQRVSQIVFFNFFCRILEELGHCFGASLTLEVLGLNYLVKKLLDLVLVVVNT